MPLPKSLLKELLYSPEELTSKGLDPHAHRTCAVPDEEGKGGCRYAKKCIFGRPENGGFGPKSAATYSPGEGPENIAIFHEDAASGTAAEKYMKCEHFMAGLFDRYREQDKTGDNIVILGGPGTTINVERMMPVDPNNNKTGDVRMQLVEEQVIVPTFREWRDGKNNTGTKRREQVLRLKEKRRELEASRRLDDAGLTDQSAEGVVVAERRKPGRPPKVQDNA